MRIYSLTLRASQIVYNNGNGFLAKTKEDIVFTKKKRILSML